jgi:ribosomal protein S12 methylthiotransferase accessory factor
LSSLLKKKLLNPAFPPLESLLGEIPSPVGLERLFDSLISSETGVLRSLRRFHKDPTEPEWPRIYRSELSNFTFRSEGNDIHSVCSGKGLDDLAARVSAAGEAVERYSGSVWQSDHVRRCPRSELESASIDPSSLVLYSSAQYAELPYDPYSADSVLGWVEGRSLCGEAAVWVPAMAALMSYSVTSDECQLMQMTSNGLAAGPTLGGASLKAALEVIERDAFISTWLLRLSAARAEISDLPCERSRKLAESYRRRGVEIELYRLTHDLPVPVFAAFGVAQNKEVEPAVVVGLGADFDALAAARSAIMEVGQVRPALRFRLRDPEMRKRQSALADDPEQVADLEDHDLLYSGHSNLSAFDFIRQSAFRTHDWQADQSTPVRRLEILTAQIKKLGHDLVMINLTPPDMEKLGLYTARAIIPGFQPIYFGQREKRLALGRLKKLHKDFAGKSAFTSFSINPDPHPVA